MEEFLGCEANKNSLKSRYRNLKANLTVMPECDQKLLLASKEIVEERLEKEKWNMIAEEMQKHGGGKYFVSIHTAFVTSIYQALTLG